MAYGPSKRNNQTWVFTTLDADSRLLNFKYFSATDDGFMGSGTQNLAVMTSSRYAQTQVMQDHDKCNAQKFMMQSNDWRDVEITGQIKFVDAQEGAKVGVFARSGDITRPCEGTGYGVQLTPDGIVRCMLRQWYPGGETELDSSSGTAGDIEDKWIGFKVCIYNDQTDRHVVVEAWIDENNNNQFQKVCATTDTGMGSFGERCGTNPNEVITWGGPLVVLNIVDCNDVFFRYLSVREIDPFNRFGIGGGVSGEGFELVNDITTLEYLRSSEDTAAAVTNNPGIINVQNTTPVRLATGAYASDGTPNSTLYKLTGRTQSVTIEGYKTRHYASGKPDDITREANTANGCPFANYEVTGYFTIDNPDHDDTISYKMYGPSHEDGIGAWYISDLQFNSGRNLMGYEEPHPDTTMDIESSTGIGSIVGKKIGYKTVIWKSGAGANVQAWADKGDGLWVLIQEVDSPDGKHFTPDSQQKVQIRIDACPNITYHGTPTVKEITPEHEFVGTSSGPGTGDVDWSDVANYDVGYNVVSTDNSSAILGTGNKAIVATLVSSGTTGQGPLLVGHIVNMVRYKAKKDSGATGTLVAKIWDASGTEVFAFGTPTDITTLSFNSNLNAFGFGSMSAWNIDNTYTMQVGDRIGVEYTPTNSGTVSILTTASSVEPSTSLATKTSVGGSWTNDTAHDMSITTLTKKDFNIPGGPVDTTPIFPIPPSHGMKDYGGPKLSGAIFHLIFWGSFWNSGAGLTLHNQVTNSMDIIFKTHYFDALIQYGLKRPTIGKIVTNTTYAVPSGTYNDTVVANVVTDSITRGQVPDNPTGGVNSYIVFAPSGSTYVDSTFLGRHDYTPTTYSPTSHMITYAIIVYSESYASLTSIACHEMVEIMAGPFYIEKPGVTGDPTVFPLPSGQTALGWIEICDVCEEADNTDHTRIQGQRVAYYWSNQDNRCAADDAPPSWVSCHIGARWDPVKQECVKIPGTGGVPVDTSMILASPLSDMVIDYGGWKWPGATAHFIFAGSFWNTTSSPFSRQNIIDAIKVMFNSKFFDYLIQYGITRPKLGNIVTNTTFTLPSSFHTSDLVDLIVDSMNHQQVPFTTPSTRHMYMVITPTGKSSADAPTAAGYHFAAIQDPIEYTVVVAGVLYFTNFDLMTITISHEIVEMMTDPVPQSGYYGVVGDPNRADDPNYNEISDICDTQEGPRISNIEVEPYYSNQDGGCVVPTTDPSWVSCHEHAIWNPVTQTCDADPNYNPDFEGGIPDWDDIGSGGPTDPGTGPGSGNVFGGDVWEKAYIGGLGHLAGSIQAKVAANGSITGYVWGNITGVSGDSLATYAGTFTGTTTSGISGNVSGNVVGTGTGTGNASNGNKTGEFTCDVTGTVVGIDSGSGVGNITGKTTGSFTALNVVEVADPGTGSGTGSSGTGNTDGSGTGSGTGSTGSGTPTPTPDPATASPTYVESTLQLLWAIDSMEGDPCSINSPTEDTALQEIFNAPPDNLYAETLNYRRVGIYVNKISSVFVGKKIRDVKCIMQRVGAQPLAGLVFCRIRAANRTIVEEFPDTIDSSLITSTDVTYEFTHPSPQREIERGDFIYIEYPSGGDASNYLRIKLCDTDKADGEASCLVTFDGVNEVINIDKDAGYIVSV